MRLGVVWSALDGASTGVTDWLELVTLAGPGEPASVDVEVAVRRSAVVSASTGPTQLYDVVMQDQ